METSKPNGRNSIAKLGYGQICLKEQNLKSNKKIDFNPLTNIRNINTISSLHRKTVLSENLQSKSNGKHEFALQTKSFLCPNNKTFHN